MLCPSVNRVSGKIMLAKKLSQLICEYCGSAFGRTDGVQKQFKVSMRKTNMPNILRILIY